MERREGRGKGEKRESGKGEGEEMEGKGGYIREGGGIKNGLPIRGFKTAFRCSYFFPCSESVNASVLFFRGSRARTAPLKRAAASV